MYGPVLDYYRITIRIKCFNDSCDNVLEHTYLSYDHTPRMDGECSRCGCGYSRKMANIKDRIVHKTEEPVYR